MTEAEILRHRRGVDDPCQKCHGWGVRSYSSTATWRGGMGGQMFCMDTCDACWGSGDEHRHGTDIRELERRRAAWEEEQCMAYFAARVGATISVMRSYFGPIADAVEALENKRKIPAGFDEFWWRQGMHAIGSTLRKFAEVKT